MEFSGMDNSYNEQEPIEDSVYWRLIKKSAIYSIAIVLIDILGFAFNVFMIHKLLPNQTISSIANQLFQRSKWDLIFIPVGMIVSMWMLILIAYIRNRTPKESNAYKIVELIELIMVILYIVRRFYREFSSDSIGAIIAIVTFVIVAAYNKIKNKK